LSYSWSTGYQLIMKKILGIVGISLGCLLFLTGCPPATSTVTGPAGSFTITVTKGNDPKGVPQWTYIITGVAGATTRRVDFYSSDLTPAQYTVTTTNSTAAPAGPVPWTVSTVKIGGGATTGSAVSASPATPGTPVVPSGTVTVIVTADTHAGDCYLLIWSGFSATASDRVSGPVK
jgi:hypothetical protein